MQIAKDSVVFVDYTLTDDDGQVIDSSDGGDPLCYLHGHGNIIPGLEKELEGKAKGDHLKVKVAPEDGYGEFNEDLVRELPKDQFEEIEDLEIGLQLQLTTPGGEIVVTVTEIGEEVVTIDGNHPLAGCNLNFDVTVRDVRAATAEELSHGHAHGPDGHHHD